MRETPRRRLDQETQSQAGQATSRTSDMVEPRAFVAQGDEFRGRFPDWAREAVYEAIIRRRDVRRFRGTSIPEDVLRRVLDAAHHAPSVGFMQPWDFVLIRSVATRRAVKDLFERERQAAACFYDEPRRSQYLALKLEGILEAPLNICVTCDPTRGGEVLGRNSMPETDVYSTCLAVQNLWLAARAEGLGVGWVSILKTAWLREILGIPPHILPVAYLCVGYPEQFEEQPLLETVKWRERLPLESVLHEEGWQCQAPNQKFSTDSGTMYARPGIPNS